MLERFVKGLTVKTNKKALNLLKQLNIRVIIDYILFDPWMSLEELEQNIHFLKKNLEWGYPSHSIIFTSLTLCPATPMYDKAIADHLYQGDRFNNPQPLFKDPDIGEIYTFLSKCRQETNSITRDIESYETKIMGLLKNNKETFNTSITNPYFSECKFMIITFNRLALVLLEQVFLLKKLNPNTKFLSNDLKKIQADYLSQAKSLHEKLKNLHFRLSN